MIKTIKTRLILTVSLIVLLSIACVSAIVYQQNIKKIESLLGQKVESIAKTGATLISGDEHEKIVANLQGANDMPEWKKLQQALSRIKKENGLQEDVYTMMDVYWVEPNKENPFGQVMFTAMATSETFQPKGQKKEEYVNRSMKNKEAGHTDIFQTVNGFFITGYAPIITTKGAVTAVIEVALEVGKEIHQARMNLIKGIVLAALIALLIAIILTVFASQKISSPIKTLTNVVLKMSGGDLKARAEGIKTNDEIQILGEGFNDMAENLERSYKELENYSKNLEKMVAERTAELAAANRKITAILNNMKLGVFVVDEEQKIQAPASAYCNTIFNADVVGKDVMSTVFKDLSHDDPVRAGIESANIAIYGEDDFQYSLMEGEFPSEITCKNAKGDDQYLEIKYSPLWDDNGNLSELLYVVDDVTELKRLQKEAEKARQEGEITNRILTQLSNIEISSLEGHFTNFRQLIDRVLKNINNWLNVSNIFMDLHTIKGNSRVLGLSIVASTIHQIETEFGFLKDVEEISDEDKTRFIKAIDEALLTLGRYNGLGEKIFKIKNFFRFPDTTRYYHFMADFLSGGETTQSVIDELHLNIPKSIPENFVSIVDEKKVVNWIDVFEYNIQNMINFEAFENLPLTAQSISDLCEVNSNARFQKFIVKDIQGASYFTDTLRDIKDLSKENQKIIIKDMDLLITFLIGIDFLIKSSDSDQKKLVQILNSSKEDVLNYMSLTPSTILYSLKSLDYNDEFNYINNHAFNLEIIQSLMSSDKNELFELVSDFKVKWNSKTSCVEFENIKLLEKFGLHLFSFQNKMNENPLYASMGNILLKSILLEFSNPLTFYSPDESINIKLSNLKEFEKWFEENNNDIEGQKFLDNVQRYPLADFITVYAPNIEKKGMELNKFVRVLIEDDSVLLSKKEFKMIEGAMVHLLTNSLAHGIEESDVRIDNNKPKYGKIIVGAKRDQDNKLSITVKDDGVGLNFYEMKLAIKNSDHDSISSQYDENMTEKDVFNTFLQHSISTKEEDDLLSGRGVGLNTLGNLVNNGLVTVDYETKTNMGTKFIISFVK